MPSPEASGSRANSASWSPPPCGRDVRRVLELCARPRLGLAAGPLRQLAGGDLGGLADLAAWEKFSPLVHSHLREVGFEGPELRLLRGYVLRDEVEARRREAVLRRAIEILRPTPVVLLKGAAVARTVYQSIAHRPMDDIDLFVPPDQIDSCRRRLLEAGFASAPEGKGEHHHHAAPVSFDGVGVELHRVFPAGGVAQEWSQVFPLARPVEGLEGALVPCPAHLLWQVWHHAFRSSLHWVPWRLAWAADLVGLLEQGGIDWSLVGPMPALAHLDELTPLPPEVLAPLGGVRERLAGGEGTVYRGWPRHAKMLSRATLLPPRWWLRLRHGIRGESFLRCRWEHLRDLRFELFNNYQGPPPRSFA